MHHFQQNYMWGMSSVTFQIQLVRFRTQCESSSACRVPDLDVFPQALDEWPWFVLSSVQQDPPHLRKYRRNTWRRKESQGGAMALEGRTFLHAEQLFVSSHNSSPGLGRSALAILDPNMRAFQSRVGVSLCFHYIVGHWLGIWNWCITQDNFSHFK